MKRISGSADSQMVVDVTRNEGTVSQGGDAFSAANMNDLEQRIADEFGEVNNNLAQGRAQLVVLDDNTLGYRLDGADAVPFFRVKTATKSGSITVATASRNNITFSFPELKEVLGISALSATTDGNNGLLYSGIYPGGGIAIYGNTITVPVYNNTSRNVNVAVSVTVVGT